MTHATRQTLAAVVVLAVAAAVFLTPCQGRLGPDGGDAHAAAGEPGDFAPCHLPPGPDLEALRRRSACKARVAAEVLDGKRSFWDGVAAFRALHPDGPSRLALLRGSPRGVTETEALARNLISFLRVSARDDARRAAVARLEREFEKRLAAGEAPAPG